MSNLLENSSQAAFNRNIEEESIDIKVIILKLIAHWRIVAAGAVIGLLTAVMVIRYTMPEYALDASVMVTDDKKGGGSFSPEDILIRITSYNVCYTKLLRNCQILPPT